MAQVDKAVTDAKNTATGAAAEASAKASSIIDQAKALVSQSKYTEALSALGNLSGLKLTAEQETALRRLSDERGTSLEDRIQRSIDEFVERQRQAERARAAMVAAALSVVGRYESGLTDVSENHDKYFADSILER